MTLVEPGSARIPVLAQAIAQRGYTAAEVELIRKEAPFANHYGPLVRLDVLDAIVNDHREMRAMLARMVTAEEVAALCTKHAELTPDDFAPGPFDRFNNRLYRYAPEIARSDWARGLTGGPEIEPTPHNRDAPVTLNILGTPDA